MNKDDLIALARSLDSVDQLKQTEGRLIDAVENTVKQWLPSGGAISQERIQDIRNKAVNSFAITLREEIGALDSETLKLLDKVRIDKKRK